MKTIFEESIFFRNLRTLLEYEDNDFEDIFSLNFTVAFDFFGESVTKPLKPNGENIAVTLENR